MVLVMVSIANKQPLFTVPTCLVHDFIKCHFSEQ